MFIARIGKIAAGMLIAMAVFSMEAATVSHASSLSNLHIERVGEHRRVSVGLNKSLIINLPVDVADVLVSNPEIADAIVRSSQRVYVVGLTVGETNMFFFDRANRQIAVIDLAVQTDTVGLEMRIKEVLPKSDIIVQGVGNSIYLKGTVGSALDAQTAVALAANYAGGEENVVNALTIAANEQVMLKVTIAEVERSIVKQLGINLADASGGPLVKSFGSESALSFLSSNGFTVAGQALNGSFAGLTWGDFSATLQALEQDGVIRTLAEPTLSAISGESAQFLAGGEFPVATGRDSSGNVTIEFKPFGVGLSFTPVVLSEDRISIQIETEVSSLTSSGALQLSGAGGNTLSIPGLTVRRANTTVELPSGGSMVMAGLIDQRTRQNINGIPGLKDLPVLGALFRSRDYSKSQTELAIFITPYVVNPVSRKDLTDPGKNFRAPGDLATIFFDRLNRRYGVENAGVPKKNYHGPFGFIVK